MSLDRSSIRALRRVRAGVVATCFFASAQAWTASSSPSAKMAPSPAASPAPSPSPVALTIQAPAPAPTLPKPRIKLLPATNPKEQMAGLSIDPRKLRIDLAPLTPEGTDKFPMIHIEGRYVRADWSLLWRNRPLPSGNFAISIPLQGKLTKVPFESVGPAGVLDHQEVTVQVDNWEAFLADKKPPPVEPKNTEKRSVLVLSLGPSYITYSQTSVPDFSEFGTTFKAFYSYQLHPRWDIGASAYYTLLPIVTNRAGYTASFLGLNFRFGYSLPFIKEPWRLSILAGGYYATMFVTQNAFGFTNLTGPQIFPTLRRRFASGDVGMTYFKLSPMANGLALLTIASREIAFGLGWIHPSEDGHSLSFNIDISNMQLAYTTGSSASLTNLTTYNFSLGYGW